MNGNWIMVLVTLKVPWAKAMVISGLKWRAVWNHWIKLVNGPKTIKHKTVPTTLKVTWAPATRLAAPKDAIIAVIVVPILSPKRTGKAPFSSIKPLAYRFCKIPMVADEAWMSNVIPVPTNTPRTGFPLNFIMYSRKASKSFNGSIAPLIRFKAKKIPPTPNKTRPILLIERFLVKKRQTAPKKRMGKA